jgi:hypothetical protein
VKAQTIPDGGLVFHSAASKRLFALLLALAVFLLLAIYLTIARIPIQFLRGESGFMLTLTANPPARDHYFSLYLRHSYNGHYTPLAFMAEWVQARLLGTSELAWLLRQAAVVTLLFLAIFNFARQLFHHFGRIGYVYAVGTASIACMTIPMLEMASWPFMVMQMLCMSLAFLCASKLVRFAHTQRRADLAMALMIGYASMHVFGVGLAVSVSAIAACCVMLTISRQWSPRMAVYVVAIFAMTTAHAVMMLRVSDAEAGPSIHAGFVLENFGSYFIHCFYEGIKSFWLLLSMPDYYRIRSDNIYGYVMFAVFVFGYIGLIYAYRRFGAASLATVAVATFWLSFSSLYVLMIVSRQEYLEPQLRVLVLVGTRYVFFSALIVVTTIVLHLSLFPRPSIAVSVIMIMLGTAVPLHTLLFAAYELPKLAPDSIQSHAVVWESVLNEVREALAKDQSAPDRRLPFIDIPLTSSAFEGLIRRQLAIPPTDVIRWKPASALQPER